MFYTRLCLSLQNGKGNINGNFITKNASRQRKIEELEQISKGASKELNQSQEKQLAGLWSKGDTYDSTLHTENHREFKLFHNQGAIRQRNETVSLSYNANMLPPGFSLAPPAVFSSLSNSLKQDSRNLFYLDGPSAETTNELLASTSHTPATLYTSNMFEDTCKALSEKGINVNHGRGEVRAGAKRQHITYQKN